MSRAEMILIRRPWSRSVKAMCSNLPVSVRPRAWNRGSSSLCLSSVSSRSGSLKTPTRLRPGAPRACRLAGVALVPVEPNDACQVDHGMNSGEVGYRGQVFLFARRSHPAAEFGRGVESLRDGLWWVTPVPGLTHPTSVRIRSPRYPTDQTRFGQDGASSSPGRRLPRREIGD